MGKQRNKDRIYEYKLTNIWLDKQTLSIIISWCDFQYQKDYESWSLSFTDNLFLAHFYFYKNDDYTLFKITWSDIIDDNS